MKSTSDRLGKISVDTIYLDLQHLREQIDEEYLFGIDPRTGVLTAKASKNIRRLELEERRLENKLLDLEYSSSYPAHGYHDQGEEFDFVRTLDAYLKEQEEDKVRQEIRAVRENSRDQDERAIDR